MIYATNANVKKAIKMVMSEKHYDYNESCDIVWNIFDRIKDYRRYGWMPENRINFEYFFCHVLTKEDFIKEYGSTWATRFSE